LYVNLKKLFAGQLQGQKACGMQLQMQTTCVVMPAGKESYASLVSGRSNL